MGGSMKVRDSIEARAEKILAAKGYRVNYFTRPRGVELIQVYRDDKDHTRCSKPFQQALSAASKFADSGAPILTLDEFEAWAKRVK